jgi:hypothetical protein
LPKEMRVGVDLVEVERRSDGVMELRPKVAVDASQSWFWTERWQQMEQEANEDIRAGRVIRSDNVDDFLAELDSGLPTEVGAGSVRFTATTSD